MNGKERVRAAIARQSVDRVPLGFYAVDCDIVARVIGRPTLVRNKVETRIALWEGRRDDLVESFKHDTVEFYRKIDCADVILPKEAPLVPPRGYTPDPPRTIGPDTWEDRHGRIIRANRDANDIIVVHSPPSPPKTWSTAEFEKPTTVDPPDESIFEAFDFVVEQLGEERYICAPVSGHPMPMLGAFEEAMIVYATQPEVIHAANRRHVAVQAETDRCCCRPGTAGCLMEQDMAGTNGPFISPRAWRELCFPCLQQRIASAKRYVDQVIYHCCGRTIPLMEMFIEAGADCYQSLQTTAGMEMGTLKRLFGDRIAFWGGVPVELLILGTPDEVRQAVREAMERGAPGGGFILGPSHSIAYGTKYENFMAMLDEYHRLCDRF